MKVHRVFPIMTDEEADNKAGHLLKDEDCKKLINYDADVYCKETDICIAKFRRNIIPEDIQKLAFKNLIDAARESHNRSIASPEDLRLYQKKDGTISKTLWSPAVNSGIIGYFDRYTRIPYCRQTAFTMDHFDKFKKAYPIIKCVNDHYKHLMPKQYSNQLEITERTSPDFVIPETVFTTVTVNKNWQTAVHTDKGDFKDGFGNLCAIRKGRFTGGYLVLVKWGVGFDMQNGDLLLMDVHQYHGNTPIKKIDIGATRLSLVMYYRENMIYCGTAEEELKRAKTRQEGEPLIKYKINE